MKMDANEILLHQQNIMFASTSKILEKWVTP